MRRDNPAGVLHVYMDGMWHNIRFQTLTMARLAARLVSFPCYVTRV